jgi:exopolysaccharide production protein ExoZ
MVFNYVNLGVAGIFLFFALSGYLMTHKVNAIPLRFIWQRLVRIMPGLWLALILAATIQRCLTGLFVIDPLVAFLYQTDEILPTYVPYWTLLYELAFIFWCSHPLPRKVSTPFGSSCQP